MRTNIYHRIHYSYVIRLYIWKCTVIRSKTDCWVFAIRSNLFRIIYNTKWILPFLECIKKNVNDKWTTDRSYVPTEYILLNTYMVAYEWSWSRTGNIANIHTIILRFYTYGRRRIFTHLWKARVGLDPISKHKLCLHTQI